MKNTIIIIIAVTVVVGGTSFFAGTKYQLSKQTAARRQFPGNSQVGLGQFGANQQVGLGQGRTGGTGTNRMGFRPVNGEITSADTKSITVKLTDGSSKIVIFSDKTLINKADSATVTDLKVGEKVAVFGSDNTDGSVTAQNIQLNPIVRDLPGNIPTGSQPSPNGGN